MSPEEPDRRKREQELGAGLEHRTHAPNDVFAKVPGQDEEHIGLLGEGIGLGHDGNAHPGREAAELVRVDLGDTGDQR